MLDTNTVCTLPEGRCADQSYRLAIYQAGHALVARALGHRILSVRLLPRPPITLSDKAFIGNNWDSFIDMLEARVIELFGGQIAESIICGSTSCCSGDISRIDELTRLLAGLTDTPDHEDIFFQFEDTALKIFRDDRYRAAIEPLAEFLYGKELEGEFEIAGAEIEAIIDQFLPRPVAKKSKLGSLFGKLTK